MKHNKEAIVKKTSQYFIKTIPVHIFNEWRTIRISLKNKSASDGQSQDKRDEGRNCERCKS